MKKLLTLVALVFSGLFFGQNISAQGHSHDNGKHYGEWKRHEIHDNRDRNREWDRRGYNDPYVYIVNEYRYRQYGYSVYRETYRNTYTRDGHLVNSVRLGSERVSDYDRYRDRNRFRFNVFLRF